MHWNSQGACALAAPALGGHGCDFPSSSSHTRPPPGFSRALNVAPPSIALTCNPARGAPAVTACHPHGGTGRPMVPTAHTRQDEEVQPTKHCPWQPKITTAPCCHFLLAPVRVRTPIADAVLAAVNLIRPRGSLGVPVH